MYKINENRHWCEFPYYNHKNSTIGSTTDISLPGFYWDEVESLTLWEVTEAASVVIL